MKLRILVSNLSVPTQNAVKGPATQGSHFFSVSLVGDLEECGPKETLSGSAAWNWLLTSMEFGRS